MILTDTFTLDRYVTAIILSINKYLSHGWYTGRSQKRQELQKHIRYVEFHLLNIFQKILFKRTSFFNDVKKITLYPVRWKLRLMDRARRIYLYFKFCKTFSFRVSAVYSLQLYPWAIYKYVLTFVYDNVL